LIGVTGTNGKTTTCYLTYQMLQKLGKSVAYLGTIGYYQNDKYIELNNTTPDILTLYKLLIDAVNDGIEYLVMEVSSHALSFERIAGLKFIAGAFTNLTEDHLDYHKTMDAYLEEKLKLVNYLKNDATMLINSDDESGERFKIFKNYKTYGLNGDYKIEKFEILPDHTNLKFSYNNKNYQVTTNLTSKFNIYNYLTCLSILNSIGFSIDEIIEVTKDVYPPKGRCETYKVGNGYAVVDYAHTPDAVEKVIMAYTELKKNRVLTIVGCGGDRDPIKRPIMGRIATSLSDYVIFTNDNPRTEDPKKIMNDIVKDNHSTNYEIIFDRKEAITKGLDLLEKDDILLILGKGHEDYQIIGREKIHFDDAEIVKNYESQK
ncbi:MAG: UDP-N-acetylmuramoyl-L-alanyl-D-glutamate--2,6-diaminopimelate ligase, partial [Firmicutes bacterium]|nr:UDP-N-acetylmuramoyl-L-alanyl-D-glutamate--2,6-diaminopimelate ligase [Bacillota bacterium]